MGGSREWEIGGGGFEERAAREMKCLTGQHNAHPLIKTRKEAKQTFSEQILVKVS